MSYFQSALRGVLWAALLGAILFVGCANPVPPLPGPSLTIGGALEGRYNVWWGRAEEAIHIGTLTLRTGQYTFVAAPVLTTVEAKAAERLRFIASPQGDYTLHYESHLTADQPLATLTEEDWLATIAFITSPGDSTFDMFLIRYAPTLPRLYFHATVSEIQEWQIEKDWAAGVE